MIRYNLDMRGLYSILFAVAIWYEKTAYICTYIYKCMCIYRFIRDDSAIYAFSLYFLSNMEITAALSHF